MMNFVKILLRVLGFLFFSSYLQTCADHTYLTNHDTGILNETESLFEMYGISLVKQATSFVKNFMESKEKDFITLIVRHVERCEFKCVNGGKLKLFYLKFHLGVTLARKMCTRTFSNLRI